MIKVVCWNIGKGTEPWREMAEMARRGEADVALLQEAGSPPDELADRFPHGYDDYWQDRTHDGWQLYDRWCRVVRLTDRVDIDWFRPIPPCGGGFGEQEIGSSGIGTMAAARVAPAGRPEETFVAVSMYASWIGAHPSTHRRPGSASDVSAHRILSDLSIFIDDDPGHATGHRILTAGDLNMFYGATGRRLSMPVRERTVWDRFEALGLEFLGPQAPNGRQAATLPPDVPADTRNVPTHYDKGHESPATARRQLDYAFASRGFHEMVEVRAMNGIDEWGWSNDGRPLSDHCRLLIEVATG